MCTFPSDVPKGVGAVIPLKLQYMIPLNDLVPLHADVVRVDDMESTTVNCDSVEWHDTVAR